MKIDTIMFDPDLATVAEQVTAAEASGYDGFWSAETGHDPFLPLTLAAEHSTDIELGTAIAVAFARNPMSMAYLAHDLQAYSGRFILGLGSQIKPHIEKRFSMPWSAPARRMREYIEAMHAIWDAWADGTPLRFKGEFYTHLLMTPFFAPPPSPHGKPKVFVAAVGPMMTKVAGEVADGLMAHGFTTESYLRDVTIPTLREGAASADRDPSDVQIALPVFVVTGRDDEDMAASRQAVKLQIAFYGSTPAYRGVLEHHGWGDVQDTLNAMSKRGEWGQMADAITDEMLTAFAVQGAPADVGSQIVARYGDIADRISLYIRPEGHEAEILAPIVAAVRTPT
jgi:probable F420-dependent oxidoreductase